MGSLGSQDDTGFSMHSPAEIQNLTLPAVVRNLVDDYNKVIGLRDEFVWKWIYSLFPAFTLNTVPDEHFEAARTQKTLLTMYVTITDDIAEATNDGPTFIEAQKIPHPTATPLYENNDVDEKTLQFLETVWTTLQEQLLQAPRYTEYSSHFRFDLNQTLNSIDYSQFVSQHPELATVSECWAYGPHNMVMYAYSDIDLMYSPGIPDSDIRQLRDFLSTAQKMARIGNWVSTWEREIQDTDYSSGIVVKALEDGIVTVEELETLPEQELIGRITDAGLETYFLEEWERLNDVSDPTQYNTQKINLHHMLDGMETVLDYHLASRGYK